MILEINLLTFDDNITYIIAFVARNVTHGSRKSKRNIEKIMWKIVEEFVFWYPAVMAMMWVLGALVFYWSNERNKDGIIPENLPFVSILMPAHNESSILKQVVEQMVNLDYPDYEVILINDGSTDNSSEVMKELSEKYDRVRVVDLDKNCGKANALYSDLLERV